MLTRERPRTSIDIPPPLPQPQRTTSSRRAAILSIVASVGSLAAAASALSSASPKPLGPLTLAYAEPFDFTALWRSLPAATHAWLGTIVLRKETMLRAEEKRSFFTTAKDRDVTTTLASDAASALRPAIGAALPDVMLTVYDEPLFAVAGARRARSAAGSAFAT